jgi:hypothetical protein
MTTIPALSMALGLVLVIGPGIAAAVPPFNTLRPIGASALPTRRFESPPATALVAARIIRASGNIGQRYGPPAARMKPRHAVVTAADGRSVTALVYDFE